MKVVYNSYAPKPYCNLFSHGELGSAGLGGLYKEVTERIGNFFMKKIGFQIIFVILYQTSKRCIQSYT